MTSTVTPTTSAAESTTRTKQTALSHIQGGLSSVYMVPASRSLNRSCSTRHSWCQTPHTLITTSAQASMCRSLWQRSMYTQTSHCIARVCHQQASPALTQNASDNRNVLVMMHGYGAGLGFFSKTLTDLARGYAIGTFMRLTG